MRRFLMFNGIITIFVLIVSFSILVYGLNATCNNMNQTFYNNMDEYNSNIEIPSFVRFENTDYICGFTIMGDTVKINIEVLTNGIEYIESKCKEFSAKYIELIHVNVCYPLNSLDKLNAY